MWRDTNQKLSELGRPRIWLPQRQVLRASRGQELLGLLGLPRAGARFCSLSIFQMESSFRLPAMQLSTAHHPVGVCSVCGVYLLATLDTILSVFTERYSTDLSMYRLLAVALH